MQAVAARLKRENEGCHGKPPHGNRAADERGGLQPGNSRQALQKRLFSSGSAGQTNEACISHPGEEPICPFAFLAGDEPADSPHTPNASPGRGVPPSGMRPSFQHQNARPFAETGPMAP